MKPLDVSVRHSRLDIITRCYPLSCQGHYQAQQDIAASRFVAPLVLAFLLWHLYAGAVLNSGYDLEFRE